MPTHGFTEDHAEHSIRVTSGNYPEPFSLNVEDVRLYDVADGLAYKYRYSGFGDEKITVAEHCALVAQILRFNDSPRIIRLQGLLHDGGEAYLGDFPTPLKNHPEMAWFKERAQAADATVIKALSGRDMVDPDAVKRADRAAYCLERPRVFAGVRPIQPVDPEAAALYSAALQDGIEPAFLTPPAAMELWLEAYRALAGGTD